ncbi:MAG: aminoglycoside phosphotransferase family protein [Desulfobacterales bacterium]
MTTYLPRVQAYLDARDWRDLPAMGGHRYIAAPLAQGEYNLNYLVSSPAGDRKLVLRVNIGTQIGRSDQIVYEYRTLKLLAESGHTPRPFFVDDSRKRLDRGVLVMAYLPGEPLDYQRDLAAAAALFAALHQVEVGPADNHLIREEAPLSLIYDECRKLLAHYFASPLADAAIRDYLKEVLSWAEAERAREAYFVHDPWRCIVNTEVNSGNFIVNRERGTIHLVDWEMPRWGDPSQDLCHFCSPLTTLWKTAFRMTGGAKKKFITAYCRNIRDKHLRDTMADRIRLRDPFVVLRGISWSAMAWVTYQTEFSGVKNPDTWQTLQRYLNLAFIRSLFDPFLTL